MVPSLEPLFNPREVAIIGASHMPGKLGHEILQNVLESGYKGRVFPVNPKGGEILGIKVIETIDALPKDVDLAIIAIPARFVLDTLKGLVEIGTRAVIVISAGFKETGIAGMDAERRMKEIALKHNILILGPNCLGLIDTLCPINASFSQGTPTKGNIALISQSGAVCTSILDIALRRSIGFSRFVSLGNKAVLSELHLLEFLKDDPHTNTIMAYLEGIEDGPAFMATAKKVTKQKPVVCIKAGTTQAGSKAVGSHTGTLAGSEKAFEAALKQTGIVRASSLEELIDMGLIFHGGRFPYNDQVAIITNAGGPGIMATDALERKGLRLASFSKETLEKLQATLPEHASCINPVDILGDALSDRYQKTLEIVKKDPNVGCIMVILTPQIMTQVDDTARILVRIQEETDKPIVGCFMGEASTENAAAILTQAGIPNYPVPERAVVAIKALVEQTRWRKRQTEPFEAFSIDLTEVKNAIIDAQETGHLELAEAEARRIMEAAGIPLVPSKLCRTPGEAVSFAKGIGFPVVMKISSPDILHKTDVGGVKLNIMSPEEVRDAFDLLVLRTERHMPGAEIQGCLCQKQVTGEAEVIIGMNKDPQFGPLVMFGMGGIYVEVMKDVSFRIAPFTRTEALEMIQEIRSYQILRGVRGRPGCDIPVLIECLLRVSHLCSKVPEIVGLDINPLILFPEGQGAMALDVRIVLDEKMVKEEQ